jgi:hypothetical protein
MLLELWLWLWLLVNVDSVPLKAASRSVVKTKDKWEE